MSAVRNLNGKEVGGRPLRIDLADSDPLLEGRSTSFGELLEGESKEMADGTTDSWLSSLPQGIPVPPGKSSLDLITQAVVEAKPGQIFELLEDIKVSTFVRLSGRRLFVTECSW
jgi:cleavage stimulation factor subunit 2